METTVVQMTVSTYVLCFFHLLQYWWDYGNKTYSTAYIYVCIVVIALWALNTYSSANDMWDTTCRLQMSTYFAKYAIMSNHRGELNL